MGIVTVSNLYAICVFMEMIICPSELVTGSPGYAEDSRAKKGRNVVFEEIAQSPRSPSSKGTLGLPA